MVWMRKDVRRYQLTTFALGWWHIFQHSCIMLDIAHFHFELLVVTFINAYYIILKGLLVPVDTAATTVCTRF
jgi:hypothetical protein